jgi:hypothetical protein
MQAHGSVPQYQAAKMPRRIVPINIDSREQLRQHRGTGVYHRCSDELNDWMSRCLEELPEKRPTTLELLAGMCDDAQREMCQRPWKNMDV